MSFVTRAGLYVIRHKMKSLILLAVLTIIATFVLTGIAIESSAKNAAKDVRSSISVKITLDIDKNPQNYKQGGSTGWGATYEYAGDYVTEETLKAISEIEGVTSYNSIAAASLYTAEGNFKFLPASFSFSPFEVPMSCTLFSEKFSGFTSGKLELVKGRHIVPDDVNVILISDELAEHNKIDIGDTMEHYIAYSDKTIKLEIIGIFTGTRGLGENYLIPADVPGNQGITDFPTLWDAYGHAGFTYGAIDIFIDDPAGIQNVYDRIANHPQIKGKTFTLTINSEEYEVIANPLESLQNLVRVLIIIVAVVSVAILALLLTIWTRGRVKETGILMSIGVGKGKIISQFILETVIIAVLAFGLAYPASNAIANKTGEFILTQVNDSQNLSGEEKQNDNLIFGSDTFDSLSGKPTSENAVNEFFVTVTPESVLWVYTMGMLLTVCAVLIASYTIMRLKPREILSKMS